MHFGACYLNCVLRWLFPNFNMTNSHVNEYIFSVISFIFCYITNKQLIFVKPKIEVYSLICIKNTTRSSDPGLNFRFWQIVCQVTKVKEKKDELTREISLPLDIVYQQTNVAKVKAVNFKLNKQLFKKSKSNHKLINQTIHKFINP